MAPDIHTYTQADGSSFEARGWGDERLHGLETLHGYTILHDKPSGNWHYALKAEQGSLKSSGVAVRAREDRPLSNGRPIDKGVRPDSLEQLAERTIPPVFTLTQADGGKLQATLWVVRGGSDWQNVFGWDTTAGYTIIYSGFTKNWHYARKLDDGTLGLSPTVARQGDTPPADVNGVPIARRLRPDIASISGPASVPVQGVKHFPVILAKWGQIAGPDNPTTVPVTPPDFDRQDFVDLLFGDTGRSMNDYFKEVSYGMVSVAGEVSDWVGLPYGHDYYGLDGYLWEHIKQQWEFYYEIHRTDFLYSAIAGADGQVDFSRPEYDEDGDCKVDLVVFIHQGMGYEVSFNINDMYSHAGSFISLIPRFGAPVAFDPASGGEPTDTNDQCRSDPTRKVQIDRYQIQPELRLNNEDGPLLEGVGVFAHEFGHYLGLPDLYDGAADGFASKVIGHWDLMCGGGWLGTAPNRPRNDLATTPSHLSAWSKLRLGWITPERVEETGVGVLASLRPVAVAGDVYQFRDGSTKDETGEYFLIENRQRIGFDSALPGDGLAVWHIDQGKFPVGNTEECVPTVADCSVRHYMTTLIQADGRWDMERNLNNGDTEDLFGNEVSALSDDTVPSTRLHDRTPSGLRISGFHNLNGVVLADFGWPSKCTGGSLVHNGIAFQAGTDTVCTGTSSITAGKSASDVPTRLYSGTKVRYRSPSIRLLDGFHAEEGSMFQAETTQ